MFFVLSLDRTLKPLKNVYIFWCITVTSLAHVGIITRTTFIRTCGKDQQIINQHRQTPCKHKYKILFNQYNTELLQFITRFEIKRTLYYILHFDTNPESLRPFVPEIWPNNIFNLSATYDLDLWPKILKIFVSHGVPIRNMYAKFHNDRLRNGWDITLWNFAKTRTNKHTNTHTNKHTHKQTWALQYLALPLWGAR